MFIDIRLAASQYYTISAAVSSNARSIYFPNENKSWRLSIKKPVKAQR